MKKLLILALLCLTACAPATPAATATPTPEPSCAKDYCIQNVYLSISDNILLIQIAMTDETGEIPIGFDATPDGTILVALYLEDESETYLVGFEIEGSGLSCYTGNDVPWTDGTLGRACSVTLSASSLAQQIQPGDPIRVEVVNIPNLKTPFNQLAVWIE